MPKDPKGYYDNQMSDEEYRRRQAARAKRRKQRRNQRLLLIGAFVLAAVLVIVSVIMVFNAILGGKGDASGTGNDSSSLSSSVSVSVAPPPTGAGYDWPMPDKTDWRLQLVNNLNPMPKEWDYDGLTKVGPVGYAFLDEIVPDLNAMIAACNAQVEGGSLTIVSGWRSFRKQNEMYDTLIAQGKTETEVRRIDPPAPYSEHHTALAVDFVTTVVPQASEAFAQTAEYAWLVEHAHEYGFILRYPAEKVAITGIDYQPFHFRYVGKEHAEIIKANSICLEEYLAELPPSIDDSSTASNAGADTSLPESGSDSGSDSGQMG